MIFYIWKPGGLVNKVIEALINASKRGVNCKIMIDSIGSWLFLRSKELKKMKNSGIKLVKSLKINLFYPYKINSRQHKKVIIIDNDISYIGSMNMVDPKFYKKNLISGNLIDIFARIKGPISIILSFIYAIEWEIETGEKILSSKFQKNIFNKLKRKKTKNGYKACIAVSNIIFNKKTIRKILVTATTSAKKELIFTTPYFIPTNKLIKEICSKAMKGVKVSIIIPKKNDCFFAKWANKFFFSKLLNCGVKIYQFNHGLLHTKSILIDKKISLIGSVNLDIRSLKINFEIILIVDNKNFAKKLTLLQYDYINQSTPLKLNNWKKRSVWNKITEYLIFYLFSSFL